MSGQATCTESRRAFTRGGTWDLLDFTTRDTEGLHNNENFYLNSSDLFLSAKYIYFAGRNWNFEFSGDLGLVSFMKYGFLKIMAVHRGDRHFFFYFS